MNLKQWIRDYALQKSRNISHRPADYKGFESLGKMAIVFESGEQDETILAFAKKMKEQGKQVSLMGYIPRKRKEITDFPFFEHFSRDELNWFGKPKSEDVKNFLNKTFEVFISLNEREQSPVQFITVAAKSDFAIGLKNSEVKRLDLQVGVNDQNDYRKVFEEIEYYLKFINKK